MTDASYMEITFHFASSLDTSKCYNILKINYPIHYTHFIILNLKVRPIRDINIILPLALHCSPTISALTKTKM